MRKLSPSQLLWAFWGVLALSFAGGVWIGSDLQAARLSRDLALAELNTRTAERNRLLEHLADLETNVDAATCSRVTVWACPVQGGGQ